jgi:hypothetical protein
MIAGGWEVDNRPTNGAAYSLTLFYSAAFPTESEKQHQW